MSAFTVGHTKSYDEYLATDPHPSKAGAYPGYEGGYVWSDAKSAEDFLTSPTFAATDRNGADYSVYELDLPTGWEIDVSPRPHPSDGVHRLLNDAVILGKVG